LKIFILFLILFAWYLFLTNVEPPRDSGVTANYKDSYLYTFVSFGLLAVTVGYLASIVRNLSIYVCKEEYDMKLNIKKKYFDEIKAGIKTVDLRDAHITFICEETGETLLKRVLRSDVYHLVPEQFSKYKDVLTEDHVIRFFLE
jgi:hypothetical protein